MSPPTARILSSSHRQSEAGVPALTLYLKISPAVLNLSLCPEQPRPMAGRDWILTSGGAMLSHVSKWLLEGRSGTGPSCSHEESVQLHIMYGLLKLPCFTALFLTSAALGSFPNNLLAPKSLSQVLLLRVGGKLKTISLAVTCRSIIYWHINCSFVLILINKLTLLR